MATQQTTTAGRVIVAPSVILLFLWMIVPLVMTESGGDDMVIHVNHGRRVHASSIAEGAALVRRYMAAGYTVDVGLAQVNSANFTKLGVTVEQAFEPCANLRLASAARSR